MDSFFVLLKDKSSIKRKGGFFSLAFVFVVVFFFFGGQVLASDSEVFSGFLSPEMRTPEVLSKNQIKWPFYDRSFGEKWFELRSKSGELLKKVEDLDLTYIIEKNLQPNTGYQRRIHACKEDTYAASALSEKVFTLAARPQIKAVYVQPNGNIGLEVDHQGNPKYTKYAIYEKERDLWLQPNYTLGKRRVFQPYSDWIADTRAVQIKQTEPEQKYVFAVQAKNEEGNKTNLSEYREVVSADLDNPNLLIKKKVGVDLEKKMARGFYMGDLVFAGINSDWAKTLPVYSVYLNWIIFGFAILLVLFLSGLILNSKRSKSVKYIPEVLLDDWRRREVDAYYHLMHGQGKSDNHQRYHRHKHFYRWSGYSFLGLVLSLAVKLGVFVLAFVLIYGQVPIMAFSDQNKHPVPEDGALIYEVLVENTGRKTEAGVFIEEKIPQKVSYVNSSMTVNGLAQTDDRDDDQAFIKENLIKTKVRDLAPGEKVVLRFKVLIKGEPEEVISNEAVIKYNRGDFFTRSKKVSNKIVKKQDFNLASLQVQNISEKAEPVFSYDEADWYVQVIDQYINFSRKSKNDFRKYIMYDIEPLEKNRLKQYRAEDVFKIIFEHSPEKEVEKAVVKAVAYILVR